MAIVEMKNSITISRESVKKTGGFVVLPLKEYEKLREQAIPVFQLYGEEAKELDSLVETGLKEYCTGKCEKIKSLSDLD